MTSELIRSLLLEWLHNFMKGNSRGTRASELQFNSCMSGIQGIASQRCPNELQDGELSDDDFARATQVVWDLIISRVLVPGTCRSGVINDGWPFLSLTDHGYQVIAERKPLPYDPDGYLKSLEAAVGGLSLAIRSYLAESLSTFKTNNLLASAVMLGAASEMLFDQLGEAIIRAISEPNKKSAFKERMAVKNIEPRIQSVIGWISSNQSVLPVEFQRSEQIEMVESISQLIRRRRNDAGHPKDPPAVVTHEEMYAMLMLFPQSCRALYALMNWLNGNKI